MRSLWLLLLFVAAFPLGAARADTASATLQVSATVLPHVRLQTDDSPVAITAADVERGYRDVSRQYQLKTNAPDRVVLQLDPRVGLTEAIEIQGLQAPVRMRETGTEVTQPFGRSFTLTYRLWLPPEAAPGEYELPVRVSAIVR
jgi:hypothetical protein